MSKVISIDTASPVPQVVIYDNTVDDRVYSEHKSVSVVIAGVECDLRSPKVYEEKYLVYHAEDKLSTAVARHYGLANEGTYLNGRLYLNVSCHDATAVAKELAENFTDGRFTELILCEKRDY